MLKNYTDAQNIYNKAISSGQSGSDYALYQKGIIAGVTGNTGQKISLLQQLSNQYPQSSYNNEADYQIAATYMVNEQYNLAIPYLQKVINNPDDPNVPKALLQLGLADFSLNDQQGAISSYQKVVTQYPNSPQANDALQSLRTLYINSGQPDAYLNFLKSIGRTVTISAEDSITYAAGESSFGNNQYASAITQLNNYLNQFPTGQFLLPAHFYLAESYFNQKDYNNALPNYSFVLSQSTSLYSERSASQAAWISFYPNKNYQQSLGYFTQLKQLSTSKENTLAALRGILRCNYELSQWPQVINSAQNLLQTPDISTDDQIVGNFYLARAQQQQSLYDSAIANYKTVAQMTKSELGAESRYFISQCYFAQNDLTDASNAAYDVIKNTPSYNYWVASAYIM
ncbi:MAG: tetratricopeptide repeat protein, partial [Chitinophagaceae bacterium]